MKVNLGDDAIETLETIFRRIRNVLLAGKKYVKIVQFERISLYELQQQLRQLLGIASMALFRWARHSIALVKKYCRLSSPFRGRLQKT
ncbi:16123_t:CDS:2, partial [Funneliformis geosporum]